jgi:hypothetical protein
VADAFYGKVVADADELLSSLAACVGAWRRVADMEHQPEASARTYRNCADLLEEAVEECLEGEER